MITTVLSLTFGAGIYMMFDGLTNPRRPAMPGWLRSARESLVRAGLREVSLREFVLFSLASGILAGFLAQSLLGLGAVSVLVALLGASAPYAYYVQRQERRRGVFQLELVEAISQLRDSVKVGLSVQESLGALARNGPEGLRPEFDRLVNQLRVSMFRDVIEGAQDRLADPVFDTFAATLLMNERLGGRNLSGVLERLAAATRAQLKVEQEARAYQAHTVTTARILAGLPPLFLVGLRFLSPSYVEAFAHPGGQLALVISAMSILTGYNIMRWMTRLPAQPRVLR